MLAGLGLTACAVTWRGFTLAEWWRESHSGFILWKADTRQKVVALTFDDGPDPRYTPRILAILRQYGVKATFFDVSRQVQAYPDLAREEVAEGHVVGNHTCSHPYLDHESRRQVSLEIGRCETCLETTLHLRTHLFRPPRGDWNPTIFREARRQGDRLILWSVAVEHHEVHTPRALAARALRIVRPGSILLMHDGACQHREATVAALPLILDGLKARGYRCVTVPELLHVPGDEAVPAPTSSRR